MSLCSFLHWCLLLYPDKSASFRFIVHIFYMCFNAGASIGAFFIGVVSLLVMLQRKMQSIAFLYSTIIVMQLAEYFAHNSLTNGSKTENFRATTTILLVVFLQPVLWGLYSAIYRVKGATNRTIIYGAVALFSLFFGYFYLFLRKRGALHVSYLKPKCGAGDKICRLDWSFFKESIPLSLVFLFFYFFLFMFSVYATPTASIQQLLVFGVSPFLLAASILFMIFADNVRDMPSLVSGFGSIWCISVVLVGPLVLLYAKN